MEIEKILATARKMSVSERNKLVKDINEITRIEKANAIRPKANRYRTIMEGLIGHTLLTKSRLRIVCWGRAILAYQLASEGYTHETIAGVVGCVTSSVSFMVIRVNDMLSVGFGYEWEHKLFNNFRKEIGYDIQ